MYLLVIVHRAHDCKRRRDYLCDIRAAAHPGWRALAERDKQLKSALAGVEVKLAGRGDQKHGVADGVLRGRVEGEKRAADEMFERVRHSTREAEG